MSSDSGTGPALASLERLIVSLPPDTRLLSELARRGLLVTRPGSGTFTAARRAAPRQDADLSWQTPALGSRAGLGPDLERLVDPVPPDAIGLASGFPDERLQPLGLLAGAASRAARRPQTWSRLPPQGLPELRSFLADEAGGGLTGANVLIASGGQSSLSAVFRHLCAP